MSGTKWAASEEEFLLDNYLHMSYEEIASSLGRTRKAVKNKCIALKLLRPDRPRNFTGEEDKYLLANFENSKISEVAKHLGRHVESVRQRAKILGLENAETKHRRSIADNIRHDYFTTIDSHEKAYSLGLITSDGYISSATNSIGIKVHPKDIELVQFLRDQLSPHSVIGTYTQKPLPGYTTERPHVTFSVSSTQMKADLAKLGAVPRKTFCTTYPDIPREFDNSFILGCFDGDGCLQAKPGNYLRWELYSACEHFLENVNNAIDRHLVLNLHQMVNRELYCLRLNGNFPVSILDSWLHTNVAGLTRKRLPPELRRKSLPRNRRDGHGVDISTDTR